MNFIEQKERELRNISMAIMYHSGQKLNEIAIHYNFTSTTIRAAIQRVHRRCCHYANSLDMSNELLHRIWDIRKPFPEVIPYLEKLINIAHKTYDEYVQQDLVGESFLHNARIEYGLKIDNAISKIESMRNKFLKDSEIVLNYLKDFKILFNEKE